MSRMPTIRWRSSRQRYRFDGIGSLSSFSRESPATALNDGPMVETAESRLGRTLRMRTTSVSPGVAPSM